MSQMSLHTELVLCLEREEAQAAPIKGGFALQDDSD